MQATGVGAGVNRSGVYEALKAVAAVSGIVAFFSLAYTFYKDSRAREREVSVAQQLVDQGWREAEILDAIRNASDEGIDLNGVVSAVQGEWFRSGSQLGVDSATAKDNLVLQGIVGLIDKNAIAYNSDGKYRMASVPRSIYTQDEDYLRQQAFQEEVVSRVMDAASAYTSRGLREWLTTHDVRGYRATILEAHRVIIGLIYGQPPVLIGPGYPHEPPDPDDKLRVLE